MTYDAVLLDSDGVLVEPPAAQTLVEAARTALDEVGLHTDPRQVARCFRTGRLDDLTVRCQEAGVDVVSFCQRATEKAVLAQRRELEAGYRRIYEDVRALWEIDRPLGVVSDNQSQFVRYLLRYCGLDELVRTVRCRSFTPRGLERTKPNPENVAAALSDLDASSAVYVGDTGADVEAAARLGIDSVFVDRTDGAALDREPDYRIESLDELPALVN